MAPKSRAFDPNGDDVENQGLRWSRRQVLQALAISTLSEAASGSSSRDPASKSRTFTFNAKVSRNGQGTVTVPISIDAATTAIIVCDMQNDFGATGGMFDRAGVDISMIQKAIAPTARVLASGRHAGMKVVYLKMAFLPDLSDLGPSDSVNRVRHTQGFNVGQAMRAPNGRLSRVLIRDNWGTEMLPELAPQDNDPQIYKHRFSGFYDTALDSTLRRLNAKHLVFTGCTTSVCVESTIRDAMFRDYLPVLLADCSAEPIGHQFSRSNHDASLLTVATLLGWVSDSAELINSLEAA
jgi:ureidoacrylate peracid hydrolase